MSDLVIDPETQPNMNGREMEFVLKIFSVNFYDQGRFDNNIITGAANTSELLVILGRYTFDKNPYIGTIADINVWSR